MLATFRVLMKFVSRGCCAVPVASRLRSQTWQGGKTWRTSWRWGLLQAARVTRSIKYSIRKMKMSLSTNRTGYNVWPTIHR